MTRVQRSEDVARNYPKSKSATQAKESVAMTSARTLSHDFQPRSERTIAAA
jgi:hypothetical protein